MSLNLILKTKRNINLAHSVWEICIRIIMIFFTVSNHKHCFYYGFLQNPWTQILQTHDMCVFMLALSGPMQPWSLRLERSARNRKIRWLACRLVERHQNKSYASTVVFLRQWKRIATKVPVLRGDMAFKIKLATTMASSWVMYIIQAMMKDICEEQNMFHQPPPNDF